jgi:Ca2+-binding RTX toxin-like protein
LDSTAAGAGIKEVSLYDVTATSGSLIDVSEFGSLTTTRLVGPNGSGKAANISGGAGADTIIAAVGGGTITGNAGADTMTAKGGTDVFVINSVVGTSSDSPATAAGLGGDSIDGFTKTTDKISVVATNVHNFSAATNVVVGSGTAGVGGLVTNFTSAVGLINFNGSDSTYNDAGDIAITFVTNTLTATELKADLKYNLTGTSEADTITGGANADTITGGKGADVLTGGATGVNTFIFNSGDGVKATSVVTTGSTTVFTFGNGVEIIKDFKSQDNGTNGDSTSTANCDILVYNDTSYAGTAAVFGAMGDVASTAGGTSASTPGLKYIVGTWDNSAKTFTEGAGADFILFNNADTAALTDVKLTGISDIMIHDIA